MTIVLIVVAAVAVLAAASVGLLLLVAWASLSLPEPGEPARPPLSRVTLERSGDHVTSLHAYLAPGAPLRASVDLSYFEGLEAYQAPPEAERRLGAPTGSWRVPRLQAPAAQAVSPRGLDMDAPYYDRPWGRLSLRPFPTPEQGPNWIPVAFPKDCTLEKLFPDQRLRVQIARYLSADALTGVCIRRSDYVIVLVASLNSHGCRDLELEGRDR